MLKSFLNFLASEVKTHQSFAPQEMWYHGSRGVQLLSALYSFNCPTFLLTHKQWKLFVENSERNDVFTFPFNDDPNDSPSFNSTLVYPMGKTFLKAIVICLLSKRISIKKSLSVSAIAESSTVPTPQKIKITKRKYKESPEKSKRKSSRIANQKHGKKVPTFISGYQDGVPIYSVVRVIPSDIVSIIENEISMKEKIEFSKQSSETTLVE